MIKNIKKLRNILELHNIDAYIIPSHDEFSNEYTPKHLKRLEWLTGFTGSNGFLILSKKDAVLATDGRYLDQAAKELDNEYNIINMYSNDRPNILKKFENLVIGYDPMIESIESIAGYKKIFKDFKVNLKSVSVNIIDQIWERPMDSKSNVEYIPVEYSGLNTEDKIQLIFSKMDSSAEYLLICNLASICWLLNIRGDEIDYTPFVLCYLVIQRHGFCYLFSDSEVNIANVKVMTKNQLKEFFINIAISGSKIQIDKKSPVWFHNIAAHNLILKEDPIELLKACKNEVEIACIEKSHFFDGLAVCKFLCWLKENIDQGITETEASKMLLSFRKMHEDFLYPSFETISAFGPNGAIIHYHPKQKSDAVINRDSLYLLDSGGQYRFGTTDVTRTLCFGTPTKEQIANYTLVLKGMIRISKMKFPIGTNGAQLDSLARYELWQNGLDYPHGTGHGVGFFLSVHEGPHSISKNNTIALKKGMILSNEPGYYKKDEYGIRIENLMLVVESEQYSGFLEFKTLTLIPIYYNMINFFLLTAEEIYWLERYNLNIMKEFKNKLTINEYGILSAACMPSKAI